MTVRASVFTVFTVFTVFVAFAAIAAAVSAQDPAPASPPAAGRNASVGMRARIDQLVLPGPELVAKPSSRDAVVVLRVLGTWPHGNAFRYDLEWTGLEPGAHDLREFLVRKDGTAAADLPSIPVTATAVLPPGVREPSELGPTAPPGLGGYRTLQWIAGGVWLAGLLAILFLRRRRKRVLAATAPPPRTLADRLRPMVEAAAAGSLDDAGKAELERLLVAFWRERLDLGAAKADAALARLREHPEAGALLRQLAQWFHVPVPAVPADVASLLAPYRAAPAEAC